MKITYVKFSDKVEYAIEQDKQDKFWLKKIFNKKEPYKISLVNYYIIISYIFFANFVSFIRQLVKGMYFS